MFVFCLGLWGSSSAFKLRSFRSLKREVRDERDMGQNHKVALWGMDTTCYQPTVVQFTKRLGNTVGVLIHIQVISVCFPS